MQPGGRKLHSVALNVDGTQYLAGWRPEASSLFVAALGESRVGDEVAIRVGIFGQAIRATIFGTIHAVRRVGRPSLPPGVELTLDPMSLPAAQFLAMAARGEPVTFRERAPRYLVARRMAVQRGTVELQALTVNLSEAGCALSWSGPLPMVGEVLSVRIGEGLFPASARGVVCWNALEGPLQRCVGVRLLAEGRAARAWRSLAQEAARRGARSA